MRGMPYCTSESTESLSMLRRLVAARWLVLTSLAGAVVFAPIWPGIPIPQLPLLGVVLVALAFNGLAWWRIRLTQVASSCELFSQLLFDITVLSAVVFFSGGAANPLVSLLLPPAAIAGLSLGRRQALIVAGTAIAAYSLLMLFYVPLPITDASRATRLHLLGMWLIFVLSASLIGWLIVHMTQQIRERDAELASRREQALRDERVMAMGTLAAGAAHELGTPLATMNLLAGELTRDARLPDEVREDLALLKQQIALCKQIITGLSRRAGAERLENALLQPVDRWLEGLRQHWHALRPQARSQFTTRPQTSPPEIVADPRLEQAVLNLLNNAANASQDIIEIKLDWNENHITIEIGDQGPGFPPSVLAIAGQQILPAHAHGSGMGLMLTRSAIEQLGGQLKLYNASSGGARARIELPWKDR